MNKRNDIYSAEHKLNLAIKRIEKKNITEENKKLILKFKEECFALGLSVKRVLFYMNYLPNIAEWLGKDFTRITKDDLKKIISEIERRDYSEWTKQDYRVVIKRFFKWFKGNDEFYPPEVAWIKTTAKETRTCMPEDLLTPEDVKNIVEHAYESRDKAFIMLLYESGARIGELLNMRIKDVEFNSVGARISLFGKTGDRRILVLNSVPYLSNWINNHPYKENRESFLWVSLGCRNFGKPVKYSTIKSLLKRLAKKAGIKKRVNPHHWRHSRASALASKLTESVMCKYFGWKLGSDQPATYVHLSGRDLDKEILRVNGKIELVSEEDVNVLEPKECSRCGFKNAVDVKFCGGCGMPLDLGIVLELQEEEERQVKKIVNEEYIKNLIQEMFEKMKKEWIKNIG